MSTVSRHKLWFMTGAFFWLKSFAISLDIQSDWSVEAAALHSAGLVSTKILQIYTCPFVHTSLPLNGIGHEGHMALRAPNTRDKVT